MFVKLSIYAPRRYVEIQLKETWREAPLQWCEEKQKRAMNKDTRKAWSYSLGPNFLFSLQIFVESFNRFGRCTLHKNIIATYVNPWQPIKALLVLFQGRKPTWYLLTVYYVYQHKKIDLLHMINMNYVTL